MSKKRKGRSYAKRVADINAIYDRYAPTGLSNREIWLRYIYPVYGISERSLYNILKSSMDHTKQIPDNELVLFKFQDND